MLSRPNSDLCRTVVGYMVNAALSEAARTEVARLQVELAESAPGALWLASPGSLHVTLLDWIAPLATYDVDRAVLFRELFEDYDRCLTRVLAAEPPIDLVFDRIEVSRDAIILRAAGDVSFGRIREAFLAGVELLPQTKRPPRIVHTTIARYLTPVPIGGIEAKAAGIPCEIRERIEVFRLVRETRIPMLELDLLKPYPLRGTPAG